MAVQASGTAALSLNTPSTLATITTAGSYQLHLQLSTLQSGATSDVLVVKVYAKTLGTSTERLIAEWTHEGAQNNDLTDFPRHEEHSIRYELTQTAGTARSFEWRIDKL